MFNKLHDKILLFFIYKKIKNIILNYNLTTIIIFLFIFLYLLNFIGFVLSVIIGLICPIIYTHNIIKNNNLTNIKHILIYWIIFGLLTFIEMLFYYVLKFIPFYYTIKSIILFLIQINNTFTNILYELYLEPFLEEITFLNVEKVTKNIIVKIKESIEKKYL
jgi:hypothetical protein